MLGSVWLRGSEACCYSFPLKWLLWSDAAASAQALWAPLLHQDTIPVISLEMLSFQAGISSVCVSKSPLKVLGPTLKHQFSSAFSPEKGALVSPLSSTVDTSPFLKGLGSIQLPGYEFAARGMLLPLPAHCLPKPDPQSPDHSNLQKPSSVQGFSLTPGISHKKPCLNPVSVCLRQCQACPQMCVAKADGECISYWAVVCLMHSLLLMIALGPDLQFIIFSFFWCSLQGSRD